MLDIILSTGTFEIAAVYDWGGIAGQIMTLLNAGKTTLASTAAKLEKRVVKAMEETVDTFSKVGQ